MGLYVSVVLVIGKFVRGFFSEISHSIMFEELPCVDRILKLCTDIFLVSEHIITQTSSCHQKIHLHKQTVCFRYVKRESWSWRRNSTPNWSSCIDLQRLWSNGLETSTVETKTDTDWLSEELLTIMWSTMQWCPEDNTWKASWEHYALIKVDIYNHRDTWKDREWLCWTRVVAFLQLPDHFKQTKLSQYWDKSGRQCLRAVIKGSWISNIQDWTLRSL